MEPTIFVVDDDFAVRRSVEALMRSAGFKVETFASAEEFLAAYDSDRPGCLLLDLLLPAGSNGLDLQDELLRRGALLPVVVISGTGNLPKSVRALKAGALDFLEKPASPEKILQCVREALDLDRIRRARASDEALTQQRLQRLTVREIQIVRLLRLGKSTKEIAFELNISARTAEVHRAAILKKMEVSNVTMLIRLLSSVEV